MEPSIMETRQQPLTKQYGKDAAGAWVTDAARTAWRVDDPLHVGAFLGPDDCGPYPLAVHRAVGGDGDGPVPGDLLCGALASCLDSTIRVVANRFRAPLERLSVRVTAEVDVRGTLCLDATVPVAFQKMAVEVDLSLADGVPQRLRSRILQTAEHCCVVYQTLRHALPIDFRFAPEATNV